MVTDLRKAAEMALEALELSHPRFGLATEKYKQAIKALCQALSQPDEVLVEREKVAKWMIERSYATGHGDTIEDLLKELEWQIAENWTNALVKGVQTEREACALICENMERNGAWITKTEAAAAIRLNRSLATPSVLISNGVKE